MEKRISFYVKYSEGFTEDIYKKLWNWSVKNSLGLPRGWCDTYERLKQGHYFLFDNWGLCSVKFDNNKIEEQLSYGVDNNSQCIEKELSIKEVMELIDTPSQLLGETEEWKPKVGEWVVSLNSSASYKEGEVCQIGHMNGDCIVKRGDAGSSKHKKYFRPARPEEIPQEEVEYVECISIKEVKVNGWACRGYKTGQIYKVKELCDETLIRMFNEDCSDWWNVDKCCFKPSTRKAYEAQQEAVVNITMDGKVIGRMKNIKQEVNKCSTINTNQNGKNESCETKSSMDRNTGAKTGQSIRLRTTGVRIKCKSGLLRSGKEVTRTIKSSPRPKAEIGRRFTKGRS